MIRGDVRNGLAGAEAAKPRRQRPSFEGKTFERYINRL
jgi:hypothetical protein